MEKNRVDRKSEEKERRKREEAMVALLLFILATLKKLLDGGKIFMYVPVVRDEFGDGKKKMLTSQTEILFPLQMPYGLLHLLVFEKFTCAYLFQIALEIM